jgi:uncharacterized protein (TIGR02466 family)
MTMNCERFELFPTRAWVFRLPQLASLFADWEQEIAQWRATDPAHGSSNRKGWTSSKTVFDRPAFGPLKQEIERCFAAAFADAALLKLPDCWTQAWVNWQEPGGFNHFHSHGTAALSAVFYLRVPPGSGDIVFRDPRPGVILTGLKGDGANCQSVASHSPKAGELLIFPGWLEHAVEPNAATIARISIAANCYIEHAAKP